MKLRILLINPWIHDFAAADLWARPLGILHVAEWLSQYDVEFAFIDCTETSKQKRYGKGIYRKDIVEKPECIRRVPRRFGRYGISTEEFICKIKKAAPFDIVLVTSMMSWWYPGVREAIACIRSVSGNVPVVLGGIYATLWHSHAAETSGADLIFKGQAGTEMKFALQTFGFRLKRVRKETVPFYRLGLYDNYPFAPLLTSTGCPFHCHYCGSGLLNSSFIQRNTGSVAEDITAFYEAGVRDFAFYDDALFVNSGSHIKVILEDIISWGMDLRFHCPNGLHARLIDDELAVLMKKAGFRTLRLSLETVNHERQQATGGKVSSQDLKQAVDSLRKAGFTKADIGVYLMFGLPGQGFEEVREGIEFLKSLNVRINLNEFAPVPGTKSWNELISRGTIGPDIDPLLTNNSVFYRFFSGYDSYEVDRLKLDVTAYNAAR